MISTMASQITQLKQILVVILVCIAVMVISYQIGISHGYRAARFECTCKQEDTDVGQVVLVDGISHNGDHNSDARNFLIDDLSPNGQVSQKQDRNQDNVHHYRKIVPTEAVLPNIPIFSDDIERLQAKLDNTSQIIDKIGLNSRDTVLTGVQNNSYIGPNKGDILLTDGTPSPLLNTRKSDMKRHRFPTVRQTNRTNENTVSNKSRSELHAHLTTVRNPKMSQDLKPTAAALPSILEPTTVTVLSQPKPRTPYAVFSCSYPYDGNLNYVFDLPLTARAWKRIGYGSIILLTGTKLAWQKMSYLYLVLKELELLESVVVFIDSSKEHAVMISQTSRLFVSNMLSWTGMENSVLVTSDADLWPLSNIYELMPGKHLMSLNSECCGHFDHKGMKSKMLPMANIVATVQVWRKLVNTGGHQPKNAADILNYFFEEFGKTAVEPVVKGENDGWFLDQHMVSLRLKQYLDSFPSNVEFVQFVPRNIGRDRLCRSAWVPLGTLEGKNDVHVLENMYHPGSWERMKNIISLMYYPQAALHCNSYRDRFVSILREQHLVNY